MKILYFLLLIFTVKSFGQTSTEKYNTYLRRYEYFDSSGKMTGYKQYNTYKNQWEYYNADSQGYQVQKPQSNVDLDLVERTLNSKQSAYDSNLKSVQLTVKSIYKNIDYLILHIMTDNPKEIDYVFANHLKALFQNKCVKPTEQKGYDYSSNSTTSSVNNWFVKNSIDIVKQELNFMEDRSRYNQLINSYISLF